MRELKRLATGVGAEGRARALQAGLARAAAAEGLLVVAIGSIGSPIGNLTIAVTVRGIARVAFADEDRDEILEELARAISPRILESVAKTDLARRQLEEYFEGRRKGFDLPVDRRLVRGITRGVLSATARVPFGRTTTYAELARRIGKPAAVRAVGNALGSNPIPVVIPCHRVLRTGGSLGGYAGGVGRKAELLRLEGVLPRT